MLHMAQFLEELVSTKLAKSAFLILFLKFWIEGRVRNSRKSSSHKVCPINMFQWFKVIPQFCIAHFYCAHLITYNFIHYTYRLKKSFYDNFMLFQNIFGYIGAKNYVKINVFKKGMQKWS